MAGGSEFRCVELCNGIEKFTNHEAFLMAEGSIPQKLFSHINRGVNIIENSFLTPEYFYNADVIITINTDSRDFSTLDYWIGKSASHNYSLDISKLKNKRMFFLYNFIISPSRHLNQLKDVGIDIGIFTTNNKFFNEITKQDRYEFIRNLPRYVLTSPINPDGLKIFVRKPKNKVCFGMHSKRLGNIWNDEIEKLIKDINKRYHKDQIEFRFMGIKKDLKKKIEGIDNVTCLDEDKESVRDFLSKLDVFLFFPDWKREEPWARVIAEAMVSGCPVIALDKGGTVDQVLKYNNGFLCKKYDDYYKNVIHFMEHKNQIPIMSQNSIRISKDFYTEKTIKKLVGILEN
jgi:glycosyltransferase involved in cell wall biosynthesis